MLDELPTSFSTPELNVSCAEGEPPKIIERLLAEAKFPGAEILTIDGLRAEYDDGFGLIRASNTTPVLVLRFEGHTQAALRAHPARLHGGAAQGQAGRARRRRGSLSRLAQQPR